MFFYMGFSWRPCKPGLEAAVAVVGVDTGLRGRFGRWSGGLRSRKKGQITESGQTPTVGGRAEIVWLEPFMPLPSRAESGRAG